MIGLAITSSRMGLRNRDIRGMPPVAVSRRVAQYSTGSYLGDLMLIDYKMTSNNHGHEPSCEH